MFKLHENHNKQKDRRIEQTKTTQVKPEQNKSKIRTKQT